jgi:hypothetical protein
MVDFSCRVSFIVPLNFRPGIDAERSSESGTRLLFCNSTVSGPGCREVSAGETVGCLASTERCDGDLGAGLRVVMTIHISAWWRSKGYRLTFPSKEKTAKIGLMRLPLGKSKNCGPRIVLSTAVTSTAGVTASSAIFSDSRKLNRAVTSDAVGLASTIRTERCT